MLETNWLFLILLSAKNNIRKNEVNQMGGKFVKNMLGLNRICRVSLCNTDRQNTENRYSSIETAYASKFFLSQNDFVFLCFCLFSELTNDMRH